MRVPIHYSGLLKFLFIAFTGLMACNNYSNTNSRTADTSAAKPVKLMAVRTGINKENAYNDLLLDSALVEQFISHQPTGYEKANDIRNFYNNRAYQFAWFNGNGFTEQALAFRSLYDYSKDSGTSRKSLDNSLDKLMATDSLAPSAADPQIISTELLMTWRFVNYLDEKFSNEKMKNAALTELVPYQKHAVDEWITKRSGDETTIASKNNWYRRLQEALQELVIIKKNGGWDSLPLSVKSFTKSKSGSPLITRLKKRLHITGQLPDNDTTPVYTQKLAGAIKNAQAQFGYPSDKILTATLLKELNIPVAVRIQQVLVNMERMRWMPDMPENKFILVNIPEFTLHVKEGNNKFDMNIITGKEGHGTVMFSGELNAIVFSPYWNLPSGIVEKEILPAMNKNKYYLEQKHMEVTGERNGIPVIRQVPGEWNELGRIKFLFPNSLNIYFHDTPHKWLFNKDKRAYSHGCIRLAEPEKLAQFLLKDNAAWTEQKTASALKSEKEKYIKLDHPVPVLIYYFTAWVDEAGILQFRKDIYGHDAAFARRLF